MPNINDFWNFFVLPNLTWNVFQHAFSTVIVTFCSLFAIRFGVNLSWKRTLWLSASVFVSIFVLLTVSIRIEPHSNLNPFILETFTADGTLAGKTLYVATLARVSNSGSAPSAVVSYELTLEINGKTYRGKNLAVPKDINFGPIIYHSDDALYEKWTKKIEVGDVVTGLLLSEFQGITRNNLQLGDSKVNLVIEDVAGRKSSVSFKVGEFNLNPPGAQTLTFPGLKGEAVLQRPELGPQTTPKSGP